MPTPPAPRPPWLRPQLLAPFAWMGVIYWASGDPYSGQDSGRLLGWLLSVLHLHPDPAMLPLLHHLLRKVAHFSEYALLAVLWGWALPGRHVAWAWAIATLYAGSDELHQAFVPGRGPALADVGIDSLGAAAGALARAWVTRKY